LIWVKIPQNKVWLRASTR